MTAARLTDDPAPAPRVATVGGRPIPVARLEERIAEIRRGPRSRHLPPDIERAGSARRWIAQELVTEEILAHELRAAAAEEPSGDGAADARLPADGVSAAAVVRLAAHVTASVSVPEGEVSDYYDRNRDRYRRSETRRVRHLLVADEPTARRAAETLAAAADVGADHRDVRRGELAGALEDALFGAPVGAVVGPIETEHGWHVARLDAVFPDSTAPYADVRGEIEAELLWAARTRAFEAWLEDRRTALAVIEPAFAHPADPVHGLPTHRH